MNALASSVSKRSVGYESISEGSRIVWLAYDSWVKENGLSESLGSYTSLQRKTINEPENSSCARLARRSIGGPLSSSTGTNWMCL